MTLTIADAAALATGIVIPLAALTLAAARFMVSRMDRAEDRNERAHAASMEPSLMPLRATFRSSPDGKPSEMPGRQR